MGFNGSGVFVRLHSWIDDRNNGIKITADRHDAEDDGFAAGLTNTIAKDGQSTTTARIPLAVGASLNDGAVGAPSLNFISDTNTGIWRIGADNIGVGVGGSQILGIAATGLSVTGGATGISLTGAAEGSRAAVAVLSSGTNEGLSIDAKGSGTIRLGASSTGAVEFSRAAVPTASDGAALGSSSLMWSDLFLASGAVLNFNNGNYTLTHSSGVLVTTGKFQVGGFLGSNGAGTGSYPALFGTSAGGALRLTETGTAGTSVAATDITGSGSFKALELSGSSITISQGPAIVSNATASSSTTTGALTVGGGVGIVGALNVGGTIRGFGTSLGLENAVWPELFLTKTSVGYWSLKPGLSAINSLDITVNGGSVCEFTTSAELRAKGPISTGSSIIVNSSQAQVAFVSGAASFIGYGADNSTAGQIKLQVLSANGGLGFTALQIANTGVVSLSGTTASTSTTTGALTVAGGVGIAGNTYIGGNLDVAGTVSFAGATLVTETGVQTLTNKTLDNPAIGTGAVLGGTFSGSPTFSGVVVFASTAQVTSTSATAFRAGGSTPVFTVDGTTGGGSGTFTVKRGDGSNQANTDIVVKANGNLYIDVGSANDIRVGQTISTGTIQMKVTTTPFSSGAADLGSSAVRWGTVFSTNADNISSDEREKDRQDIYLGLDFIRRVDPWAYVRKDDETKRLRFGVSAQQVRSVLDEMGMPETIISHDKKTDKYGASYDEFIAPLIAAAQEIHRRLSRVESHLVL